MNTLDSVITNSISSMLARGVSIRSCERMTGVHRDTIMRLKHQRVTRIQREDGICRATAQGDRVSAYKGEIPDGMRLGWTCAVPYCDNPEHFSVVENKNSKKRDYRTIRAKLWELPEEGFIDLPWEANDEKSIVKFRCAIQVAAPHIIVRKLTTGGLRIIRTGFYYESKADVIARHPVYSSYTAKVKNTIGSVFLGQFWGTWDAPKEARETRVSACSEKSCVFPRMHGATVCRAHWDWDSATVSYPREQKIYIEEMYAKKSDDRTVDSPHALFHTGWLAEDKYNFMHTTTLTRQGGFVQRSRQERENDKWWKENVIDRGIEAPGVMVRKTSKELKAEMEAMIDSSLAIYSEQQSEHNLKAFWRVSKEPKPLHDDPFHPNAQRLRIGDGASVSLKGKMRRGGGHGQGIRKKQRKRAAGWTSSRHNHDPQYFTRDSVRTMEYEESFNSNTSGFAEEHLSES